MKVKTWIRKYVSSYYIDNEKARRLLFDNGIHHFSTYKEEILDIDLHRIIDSSKADVPYDYEAGYRYCNRLYNLVHSRTKFVSERYDLEYEIIEDGYSLCIA